MYVERQGYYRRALPFALEAIGLLKNPAYAGEFWWAELLDAATMTVVTTFHACGRLEDAVAVMEDVCEVFRAARLQSPELLVKLALAYAEMGRFEQCVAVGKDYEALMETANAGKHMSATEFNDSENMSLYRAILYGALAGRMRNWDAWRSARRIRSLQWIQAGA